MKRIYEIVNKGKGVINNITPSNLLKIEDKIAKARDVKIIDTTAIYPLIQEDTTKFLVIRSDFDLLLPLLLQDNSQFVIKNDSGFSREITFDTDIEFLGSPIIPDGALCFLKKIETTPLGVEIYSVDSIGTSGATPTQQLVTEAGNTITNLDLYIVQEDNGNLIVVNASGDEVRITSNSINVYKASANKNYGINENGFYYLNASNSKIIKQTFEEITEDYEIIHRAKSGTVAHLDDLTNNLMLFPTTADSDIATYKKLVTNTADADYDDTAVDVSTGALTTTDVLISSLASESGLLSGNPGVFEVSVTGNIRRTSGTANGTFYFEVYHRDSGGTETLICTSDVTPEVSSATYVEFSAKAVWNNGDFSTTDRIVYKFYGSKDGGGSNPTFDFQFGGTNPVRSTVPVAATLLLQPIYDILEDKADLTQIPKSVILSATINTTSTTAVPTDLECPIAANANKSYIASVQMTTPTGGGKIEISAPIGAEVVGGQFSANSTSTTSRILQLAPNTLSLAIITSASTSTIILIFSVRNGSTAGNITVSFASVSGSSTGILAGSQLIEISNTILTS